MRSLLRLLVFFMLLFFFSVSCDTPDANRKVERNKELVREIDPFLDTLFSIKYPNYNANEIVRAKALKEMVRMVDSLLPIGVLEDIPLKVFKVKENPHGKGAIVQFYSVNKYGTKLYSDRVQFDIIGLMETKLAETVNEKKMYVIKGSKYRRLNEAELNLLVNQIFYSPDASIVEDNSYRSVFNYRFGDFICEVDSVVEYKK